MWGTQPTFSYFDVGSEGAGNQEPERFYHGFVLGLIADQTDIYEIRSNRESGFGRYDVVLEPKDRTRDVAVILEFKVLSPRKEKGLEETAQAALQQIKDRRYREELQQHGMKEECIREYGFAFEGKKVLIIGA